MKQISITIALALLCTIANAQNIIGSHQVRVNDEESRGRFYWSFLENVDRGTVHSLICYKTLKVYEIWWHITIIMYLWCNLKQLICPDKHARQVARITSISYGIIQRVVTDQRTVPWSISVMIGSLDGSMISNIVANQKLMKGRQQLEFMAPQSGIYSIALVVNGCVYKQKVTIK